MGEPSIFHALQEDEDLGGPAKQEVWERRGVACKPLPIPLVSSSSTGLVKGPLPQKEKQRHHGRLGDEEATPTEWETPLFHDL